MTIEWYPGHMKKARQTMAEALSSKDVLLEVLDARMPRASSNPVLTRLRKEKPCLKILSKSDLADPAITQAWLRAFARGAPDGSGSGRVAALALGRQRSAELRAKIFASCEQLAPQRVGPGKRVRLMVVGIPNVGKSTLINTLMERKVARVGDEPAVTKSEQLVTLKNGMTLLDNAGILWPRMSEAAALRLALGGALPDSAVDYENVAVFAARFLLERYPEALRVRYQLQAVPATPEELLVLIGQKHGSLRRGGQVQLHKAADILVHDFRAGSLGRISLEAPSDPPDVEPEPSPQADASLNA